MIVQSLEKLCFHHIFKWTVHKVSARGKVHKVCFLGNAELQELRHFKTAGTKDWKVGLARRSSGKIQETCQRVWSWQFGADTDQKQPRSEQSGGNSQSYWSFSEENAVAHSSADGSRKCIWFGSMENVGHPCCWTSSCCDPSWAWAHVQSSSLQYLTQHCCHLYTFSELEVFSVSAVHQSVRLHEHLQ